MQAERRGKKGKGTEGGAYGGAAGDVRGGEGVRVAVAAVQRAHVAGCVQQRGRAALRGAVGEVRRRRAQLRAGKALCAEENSAFSAAATK